MKITDGDSLLFIIGLLFLVWIYWAVLSFLWKREKGKGNVSQSAKIKKSADACWKYNIFVSVALILVAIAEQMDINFRVDVNTLYYVGIAFLAFPLLDWYTTSVAIGKLGAYEANPLMNVVITKLGMKNVIFITVPVVSLVSMELILKGFIPLSFLIFSLVYSAVIVNNLIVIRKKKSLQGIGE